MCCALLFFYRTTVKHFKALWQVFHVCCLLFLLAVVQFRHGYYVTNPALGCTITSLVTNQSICDMVGAAMYHAHGSSS